MELAWQQYTDLVSNEGQGHKLSAALMFFKQTAVFLSGYVFREKK